MEIISKTQIHDSIEKNLTEELKNIYNKFVDDSGEWSWAVRSSGNFPIIYKFKVF